MRDDWKSLKREFVDSGYVILDDWLDSDLVERIRQEAHQYGDIAIFERERAAELLCHARIVEFISTLLETPEVAIRPFRFWNHLSKGGAATAVAGTSTTPGWQIAH